MKKVECHVADCQNNRKDNGTCNLDSILINERRECQRYILDIDYLKNSWWSE